MTTGTVTAQGAGGPWDPFGGAPDPQVCLTISGRLQCTAYAADTFSATWNYAIATTAGALQAGVPSSYLDYDTGSFSDPICNGYTIAFTRDMFTAGGGSVSCEYGRWNFVLRRGSPLRPRLASPSATYYPGRGLRRSQEG